MVNKPMSERTIVDNVLVHGVGAVNVDACRIPYESKSDFVFSHRENALIHKRNGNEQSVDYMPSYKVDATSLKGDINKGRFPANLLVSDGALDNGKITKSRTGFRKATKTNNHTISFEHEEDEIRSDFNDVGGQSRYFSLDAWAKKKGIMFSDENSNMLGVLWKRFIDALSLIHISEPTRQK